MITKKVLCFTTILFLAAVMLIPDMHSVAYAASSKAPTKVKLNVKKKTMYVNGTFKLKVKLSPTKSKSKFKWKSSNSKIVSVSKKGKLTAKKLGKATITVKSSNGKKAKCIVTVKKTRNYGNSSGNLNNGGLVAKGKTTSLQLKSVADNDLQVKDAATDGWIFYIDKQDNISKMRSDCSQKTKVLTGVCASSLNIIGDWIYFKGSYDDSIDPKPYYGDAVCKVKTDGTEFETIYHPVNAEYIDTVSVIDDWIYFEKNGNPAQVNGLYQVKTDGTGFLKLMNGNTSSLFVVDNCLYFIRHGLKSEKGVSKVFKMDLNNATPKKVSNTPVGSMCYFDGKIYFTPKYLDNWDPNPLCSMDLDGKNKKVIYKKKEVLWSDFNVIGGKLYFCAGDYVGNKGDGGFPTIKNQYLYSVSENGKNVKQILKKKGSNLNIADGKIYYQQDTSGGISFKRMTLSGKKVETIYSNK